MLFGKSQGFDGLGLLTLPARQKRAQLPDSQALSARGKKICHLKALSKGEEADQVEEGFHQPKNCRDPQ